MGKKLYLQPIVDFSLIEADDCICGQSEPEMDDRGVDTWDAKKGTVNFHDDESSFESSSESDFVLED